jgi:hypothetical protein
MVFSLLERGFLMQRLETLPWEVNHPLNGHPCPVTRQIPYIENKWKVSRSDYRLKTGILEHGVVLSLPVGYTKISDTKAFFEIMHMIRKSSHLNSEQFVLVEDYTFHTGSDYEGRVTYIRRMIDEINPRGIIFITRATNWKLSIQIGKVLYGSPFPIKCVSSYREALSSASEILGRTLAGSNKVKTVDKMDVIHFALSIEIPSTDIVCVKYSGCPYASDLSSITDFYMGLPDHPKLVKTFRTIHDLSSMTLPPLVMLFRLVKLVLSRLCDNGATRTIIIGESILLAFVIRLLGMMNKNSLKVYLFKSIDTAISSIQKRGNETTEHSDKLQIAAIEMLETIAWDKPGYYELEYVKDPALKPLVLMLGAVKQDVDYYIDQRQKELEKLEEAHLRARELSIEIDKAFQRSERDRISAEILSNENLSLSIEISKAQKEVFLVLADYIDERANVEPGSTRRLAQLVSKLAVILGYSSEECTRLHDATLLYHVGYLGIGEHEQDTALHCVVGSEVLGKIYTFIMQYAAHIAHYHHEKWNGMGYPERLAGESIPREARLIALAEFILLCPVSQFEYALSKESDSSFDPEMVTTLLLHKEEVLGYLDNHQE